MDLLTQYKVEDVQLQCNSFNGKKKFNISILSLDYYATDPHTDIYILETQVGRV